MAAFLAHKVVATLPDPLAADSLYCVRVGAGFDLYVTNGSGQIAAYALNGSAAPQPWTDLEIFLPYYGPSQVVFVDVEGIVSTDRIEIERSALAPTGRGNDEHLADPMQLWAWAGTDGFWFQCVGLGCNIGGTIRVNYRII